MGYSRICTVVLPKEEHSLPISMVEISKEFPIPLAVTKTDSLEGLYVWKPLCLRNWEAQFIFCLIFNYIYL